MKKYRDIKLKDEELLALQQKVDAVKQARRQEMIDDDDYDVEDLGNMKSAGDAVEVDDGSDED
jgi:DNA-directed RNA polymerase subunit beta'